MTRSFMFLGLCAAATMAAIAGAATAGTPGAPPPGGREQLIATFEAMPQEQLMSLSMECDREASRRMMGLEEALPCGVAWDILLRRKFGGDFDALLAWWRSHRRLAGAIE